MPLVSIIGLKGGRLSKDFMQIQLFHHGFVMLADRFCRVVSCVREKSWFKLEKLVASERRSVPVIVNFHKDNAVSLVWFKYGIFLS